LSCRLNHIIHALHVRCTCVPNLHSTSTTDARCICQPSCSSYWSPQTGPSCLLYRTQRHLGCHGGNLKALRIWQCSSKLYTNIYILLHNSLPFVYLLAGSVAYTIHKPRLSFFQTNKRTRESSTNLETNILTTTRYTAKKRRFRTNYRDILHPILNPTCSSRPHHRRILTRGTNSPKHYIYSSQHTILFLLFLHAFITLWNSC
jgi:hypothetical protein